MNIIKYMLLLLVSVNCLYSSHFQTSSLNNSYLMTRNNNSSQKSAFHNGYVYTLYTGNSCTENIVKYKISSGNKVTKYQGESFPEEDYLCDVAGAAMSVYNGALFVFADFENGRAYNDYYYRTDKWHGKDSWEPYSVPGNKDPIRRAAAVIKDTLGYFYVDFFTKLYYQYMLPDGSWTEPLKIADNLLTDTYDHTWDYNSFGNISCVTYTLNNQTVYVLGITSTDHKKIHFWFIDSQGNILEKHYHNMGTTILNISLIDGSIDGGNHGNPIQCFYSKYGSTYNCSNKIGRFEFYPKTLEYKKSEVFNSCINASRYSFNPSTAAYIEQDDDNNLHKKIIMTYEDYAVNYMNKFLPSYKFYVWNSDRLELIHEVQDTTIDSFRHLVGLVEGPPPYALNGYHIDEVAGMGFDDLSSINLGKVYGSDKTSSNGFQTKVSLKCQIFGISASFANHISKEDTYSDEFEHSTSVGLLPFSGDVLMKVEMIPHFNKKTFTIMDYSGRSYDTVSTISCIDTKMSYRTDHLSKTNQNLVLSDVSTYLNRNIDFDAYDNVYETAFQHVAGALTSNQLSLEKEYSHTNSSSLSFSSRNNSQLDSLGFFQLFANGEYQGSIEITTTTKMGTELGLTLHCPGGDNTGEILQYKGLFHWMKWTEGEDNWWKIEGMETDKPWIMTYEIFSIDKYK